MTANPPLQPLSLGQTVVFFGVPWLLFMTTIYLLLPVLDQVGVPLFLNFLLCLGGPLALLLIAAGVAYQWEGRSWTWPAFRDRFWTLFHAFFYWELLLLLPGCLALAFVASKGKNTWPGIIAHFAYNVPSLVFIVMGVLR